MPDVQRPNILWICTDQQRCDTIASLGNDRINTPNIDRLVDEGVTFTNAFCQSPVCTPSRASFLTGRYASTTGCRQNGQKIPETERLIPRLLADEGYRCGLAGKLHLASCANGRVEERIDDGYDVFHWSHHPQPDWPENAYTQWLHSKGVSWHDLYAADADSSAGPDSKSLVTPGMPAEYHQTTWCAEMAIDFIREMITPEYADKPWLFSVNCFDPHHAFDPPADYLAKYNPADMPVPKTRDGEWNNKTRYQQLDHQQAHNEPGYISPASLTVEEMQEMTAAYYAMIELIDDQVGRMVAALEDTGQLENTIVIFMSDHGEMLGDHGLYLKGPHFYDEAVRVPLITRYPKHFQQGLQANGLVELIDIAPTLLQAANIELYAGFQGRSLWDICTGKASPDDHREHVYCEYDNAWTHHRAYGSMLRTKHEKIVAYHGVDEGELYDLRTDPEEFHNLWNEPSSLPVKTRLLKSLLDARVFTLDPLPPRLGPF